MELSKRLFAAASLISEGNTAADVGCDHGYAAIWLVQTGRCPRVIATDVRNGPLSAAEGHIKACGLTDYIEIRISDGLAALAPGEAESLLMAGMGGRLMVRILEEGMEKALQMQELVLQPQSELFFVRRFLREKGWLIEREDMVLEDGKFYPMFRALTEKGQELKGCTDDGDGYVPGGLQDDRRERPDAARQAKAPLQGQAAPDPQEQAVSAHALYDTYGKLLLARRHPVLRQYLEKEQRVCMQILTSVSEHAGEGKERRLQEVRERLRLLEEALSFYITGDRSAFSMK